MISFTRINNERISNEDMNQIGEVNIFHTSAWLNYLAEFQNAEPVIALIKSDNVFWGYFIGMITTKFGLKILGSPFRGWQSYFMGFNLLPDAPKREILQALREFAFSDLGCHYLEVIDPNLSPRDWEGLPYESEYLQYYGIDLVQTEDELFANMDSTGRNCIRKSVKNGVVIEEASDIGFAGEYYAQYKDVLAKRSLTPAYSLASVKKLIEYNFPTGNLLLLRAMNSDGICLATGIFLALNKTAVFWGAASWHQYQQLRPNEPIAWYGMKTMKSRGVKVLHFGGKCEHYKEKLGATELELYRIMSIKYKLLRSILYPLMSSKNEKYRNWILKKLSQ